MTDELKADEVAPVEATPAQTQEAPVAVEPPVEVPPAPAVVDAPVQEVAVPSDQPAPSEAVVEPPTPVVDAVGEPIVAAQAEQPIVTTEYFQFKEIASKSWTDTSINSRLVDYVDITFVDGEQTRVPAAILTYNNVTLPPKV